MILSLFVLNKNRSATPNYPEAPFITWLCIRAHDNVRDAYVLFVDHLRQSPDARIASLGEDCGADLTPEEYYDKHVTYGYRDGIGMAFKNVSYNQCKNLIAGCLKRMKDKNRVLGPKDQKAIVRLFSLESARGGEVVNLPRPAPAPHMHHMWLLMKRPEYYNFHVIDEVKAALGNSWLVMSKDRFEAALDYVFDDSYRRERLLGQLEHMAMYHMLSKEEEEASWLLCERQALMRYPVDHAETIRGMKQCLIAQFMVLRNFDPRFNEYRELSGSEWSKA